MQNEYKFNEKFKKYVDKYCIANKCTVEEAFRHELVRQAYLYYTEV